MMRLARVLALLFAFAAALVGGCGSVASGVHAVAPGTHRAELVYRPVTWDLSLRLAGAGLAAAIGWWLLLLSGARARRPGWGR